jgi:transcription elongation factor GreA
MTETIIKNKEDILLDIEEKLKEEKWTRAAIESYSVRNFIELDSIIRMSIDDNFKDELKNLCRENLKHYQNSVVGLYIIGVLSLEESSVDDTHIPQIIKLFMDNKKLKISEFLAEKILSYRENKFALKTLETVYEDYGNQDELFNIKKRLVLIDSKDAANAKYLGEYYEKEGDKDQAMFYYRLAMERYIKARSVKMVEDLWNKVIKLYPEDANLVISMSKKITDVLGEERTADMVFNDFIRQAIKNDKYKEALKVLKVIIDFKQTEKQFRKAIEDCYRHIYKDHSQLEKYLKLSAIGQSWKPHKEAIRIFETHIAFDKGSYVSHKSWGIGQIKEIQNDKVIIDFEEKKNHEMSLDIALRALEILDQDNIIIWKKHKTDELQELIKNDPLKVIEIVLQSNRGEISSSEIKNYFVPDIMKESEWNKWWLAVKKLLETSETVVLNPAKRNIIELRDNEQSVVDEIISKFKKTTTFENKIKLFIDFILRGGNVNSASASAMVDYFTEIIKASSESNEKQLVSLVVLKYSNYEKYSDSDVDSSKFFEIKNLYDLYDKLDPEIKKTFLMLLMKKLKDWDLRFADIITHSSVVKLNRFMLNELEMFEKFDVINNIFVTSMNGFHENPELFLWISRVLFEDSSTNLKDRIGVRESEVMFRLLSLIDILNDEIEAKTNIARNKKIIQGIYDILFKKKMLDELIKKSDEATSKSILSLLYSILTLEADIRENYINKLIALYPSLKKISKQEKILIRHPFLVTEKSLEAKKRELARIMSAEIPENSRAIGEAMEKGDLRENAEYKSALEKQDQLKALASKLETEINQAKAIDRTKVNTSIVDVGVKVTIKAPDGILDDYQILGQWDVNFNTKTISYHSPLGKALLDRKIGDKIDFEYNGELKKYEIVNITLADFA